MIKLYIVLMFCVYSRNSLCVHLCRADGLTQLTGNAAFLSIRVATEGVFSTKAGRQRAFLKWIVDSSRLTEQVTHGHRQTWRECHQRIRESVTHLEENAGVVLYFSYGDKIESKE